MALKRTMIYADADDLAIIKEAAGRDGVSEAEIIREAIHLAALAKRTWDQPLEWPVFEGPGNLASRTHEALGEVFDATHEEHERRVEKRRSSGGRDAA